MDDAFLIDLSQLRSVYVDPKRKIAWVEPGATLGDLDDETRAFGLATPVGDIKSPAIASTNALAKLPAVAATGAELPLPRSE